MSIAAPEHVTLNSEAYRVYQAAERPFAEPIEPAVERQAEIPGSDRPARTTRHDVPTWKIDNWTGGEGRKHFDTSDPITATQYFRSSAAIDVSVPGQVSLGLATTESLAIATIAAKGAGTARGPQIAVTRGNPVVFYTTVGAVNAQERTTSPDTWTARTVAFDGDGPTGPLHAKGGILWVGDRGTGAEVHRILTSGTWTDTKFSAEPAESPLLINNRVYALRDLGTTTPATGRLYEWDPSATVPVTATERILLKGTGSAAFSNLAAIPPNLYFITQDFDGEPGYVWQFDAEDAAGREFLELPKAFRIESTQPWRLLESLNNVMFVAGFEVGASEKAAVLYFTEETSGTVGRIRDDVSMRATCLRALVGNDLLIGTNVGDIYRYDMATGGISLFAETGAATDVITGIELAPSGHYYIGVGNAATPTAGSVDRTTPTGTGKYVAQCDITQSTWDFDLPEELKILHEVELHTETIAAGTSVELQFALDDAAAITTDAAGATMAHTSGTRSKFTLSNAGTERTFRYLKPLLILKTSTSANTPIVYSLTIRCLQTGFVQFFEMWLDCTDESAGSRYVGSQKPGIMRLGDLRTLRDATSNYLFNFQAHFPEAGGSHPAVAPTTHVCKLERMEPVTTDKGQTLVFLRLRKAN